MVAATPQANGHARTLVGPDGRPLQSDRGLLLPHHQTFAAVYNAHSRLYRYTYDEAVRQDPQKAAAMARDGFLLALRQERTLAAVGLPWRLEGPDPKNERQKALCEQVAAVIRATPYFTVLRYYLLDGRLWYGRMGAQLRWGPGADAAGRSRPCVVLGHVPVSGDKIVFDYDGRPLVSVNGTWASKLKANAPDEHHRLIEDNPGTATMVYGDRTPLLRLKDPRWRQRFIVARHVPEDRDYWEADLAGGIGGVGLREKVFWLWDLRMEFLSWATDYMQKVGANGLMIFPYQDGNAASQAAAEDAARSMNDRTAFTIPVPPGVDAKSLAPFNIPAAVEGVKQLTDLISTYFEKHIERLFVGQSMSSGSDGEGSLGGTGRANFARDTKWQITKFDGELEGECFTTDLIGPILRYNFPGTPFPVQFKTDIPDPESDKKVESAKTLFDMGVEVKVDELREACGYSKPEPDDEVVGLAGEEVMVGGEGGPPGRPGGAPPNGQPAKPRPGGKPGAPPPGADDAGPQRYAFDESQHPRNDAGEFVSRHGPHGATSSLRAHVETLAKGADEADEDALWTVAEHLQNAEYTLPEFGRADGSDPPPTPDPREWVGRHGLEAALTALRKHVETLAQNADEGEDQDALWAAAEHLQNAEFAAPEMGRADGERYALGYAADSGHWVTMGAQGPEGDKHGGTPVYLVGGKIAKGPAQHIGKAVGELKKRTAAEAATQGPTLHAPGSPEKAAIAAQRVAAGLPPEHPQDMPVGGMPLALPGQPTSGPLPPSAPPGTPTGPTAAALGSPERMAAMRAREAAGLPVHDPGDTPGQPTLDQRMANVAPPSLDERMANVAQPEARRDPTIGELAQGPDVGKEPGVGKPGQPGRFGHQPEPAGKGGTVPKGAPPPQSLTPRLARPGGGESSHEGSSPPAAAPPRPPNRPPTPAKKRGR